jgi:hypothetical protein
MKHLRIIALILIAFCMTPISVRACPLCADAIANANNGSDNDDVDQFPAAMNQSIYFMLAVPYSALGIVGFLIYRGVKQNEQYRKDNDPSSPQ